MRASITPVLTTLSTDPENKYTLEFCRLDTGSTWPWLAQVLVVFTSVLTGMLAGLTMQRPVALTTEPSAQ